MSSLWRNRHFPLHIQIATLFSLLMFLVGALLIGFNYFRANQLNVDNARNMYSYISNNAATTLDLSTETMGIAVNLLTTMPITTSKTLEQRIDSLPRLQEVLRSSSYASAVYAGYTNGDMLLMRRLTPLNRDKWQAPNDATWLVQSIDHNEQEPRQVRRSFLYFDDQLHLLRHDDRPDYLYDPRERSWYQYSINTDQLHMTPIYAFASSREIGTTLSQRAKNQSAVIGIDISLHTFSNLLRTQSLPSGSKMALISPEDNIIASLDPREVIRMNADHQISITSVTNFPNPPLSELLSITQHLPREQEQHLVFTYRKQSWFGSILPIHNAHGVFRLAIATPANVMLANAIETRNQSTLIACLVLLASIPITWWIAYRIANPLNLLRQNAEQIRRFNFDTQKPVNSIVLEIDELAQTMDKMRSTIQQFLRIGNSLAAEHDFTTLLTGLMQEITHLVGMKGGVIYLPDRDCTTLIPALWLWSEGRQDASTLPPIYLDHMTSTLLQQALQGTMLHQHQISADSTPELLALSKALGPLESVLVAMRNRNDQLIGLLVLVNPFNAEQHIEPAKLKLVEALAGSLSVTVETQRLLQEQKNLLDAFIQLMAGAIDTKSAYTGGHCQRVPVLTEMLAEAAIEAKTGPFAKFSLSANQREELHIASRLHDCGKVTTPEFVVDKATKLETIYDRLHEIRMRIEVLKRDAKIHALEQQLQGLDPSSVEQQYQSAIVQLDEDFRFIATCNIGGEFMSDEHLQRLQQIAERRWLRTLDDRIGVSHEELQRKNRTPAPTLPVWEPLLADRDDHLFPREARDQLPQGYGFNMQAPHYLYNRGELYNLSVRRGTLTDEERYKINEHIVQTIVMLKTLPFPRNMSHVPEIAGGHHERMDGKGYPCRLTGEQMSLTARMMAIADVFEALTAVDRPYKKGKTLSESLGIMANMVQGQHLDPQLFALFLSSGIWYEYARRYMRPEQIDEVDIQRFMPTANDAA